MQIQIIPNDYPNANELTNTIKRVLKQHPLLDSSSASVRERLFNMLIEVKLGSDIEGFSIALDIKKNRMKLSFGRWHLADGEQFEKALYHEFTHVIDRLNPSFGIDCQTEDEARNIQPREMTKGRFMLYESVWNCYIDGRLAQFGQNPVTLQKRVQELHDITKHFGGHFTSEVGKILECAWNSKNLTFNEIVGLVQKCLQYWQPKETEET